MTELKPCRFCGGEPKVIEYGGEDYLCSVFCRRCDLVTPWNNSKDEAVTKWNTRHTGEQRPEGVPEVIYHVVLRSARYETAYYTEEPKPGSIRYRFDGLTPHKETGE